jgi:phage antirepressor YoqD-like protein
VPVMTDQPPRTSALVLTPINGEPRIKDLDLAVRLGFERPAKIRDIIKRNEEKLKIISILPTMGKIHEGAGRPTQEYYLDRQQALLICMKSATDNAFDVQIDIIRVYDAHLHCEPVQKPVLNPANFSRLQLIELAMQAEQERLALQSTVAAIQPKADALDRIATQSSGTLNLTNAAKTLQVNPKALIQHLSANRWIYRRAGGKNWTAYQDKLQQGVLEHKITKIVQDDGTDRICEQVLVTPKGLAKLAAMLSPLQGNAA